jgi:hypothetical protein
VNLYDEFFTITRQLQESEIRYAVVGGIAMAFHDEPRFTRDIDVLVLPDAMGEVRTTLEDIGYFESSEPWTFTDTNITLRRFVKAEGEEYQIVDVLAGHGKGHEEAIEHALMQKAEKGTVRVVRREDLIRMKRQRNSDQDQIDIQQLHDDKNRESG